MLLSNMLSRTVLALSISLTSSTFAQNEPTPIEVPTEALKESDKEIITNLDSNAKVTEGAIKAEPTTKEAPKPATKKKKSDSEVIIEMILALISGLGIFLLGMKYMSEGLQAVAGNSLKKLIKAVTDNRVMACGVGILVTLLVQSSSITTVMAVGFVNSTIMELHQAIGVILGANIGTTITGWVLFLKIGKWGLPIMGLMAFIYIFGKKDKVKFVALAFMGMGMVFFGLEIMTNGFAPIKSIPAFEQAFTHFEATSYFGVLKCAFVGCILTVIVQSSSATLGITIALAITGAINFETAAALVLGENIGTTITAFLASIGSSSNAKKAAYFHIFFNIFGVLWITAIFPFYIDFIKFIISFMGIQDVYATAINDQGVVNYINVTGAIAMVHSVFNITNVLLFLPFTGLAANLLNKFVGKSKGEGKYLTHLDFHIYDSAFAAIEQSAFEVKRMDIKTRDMMLELKACMLQHDTKQSQKIFESENVLDVVQTEIIEFLTDVLAGTLSLEQTEEAKTQLVLADEYESISDYIVQILKYQLRIAENGFMLSEDQKQEIFELHDLTLKFYDKVHDNTNDIAVTITEAMAQNESLSAHIKKLRNLHWDRISNEKMPPLLSTSYSDIINAYRKIKNHLIHVIEVKTPKKH